MPIKKSDRAGSSGAEEQFVQLFCEAFGVEKAQFMYLQHPFVDIYGNHRTIDFAVMTEEGKVAFEIDGETWHNPGNVSKDKYVDDLLKQNSMVYQGWRVFRWTDTQLVKTPDRVKDELITFLGYSPALTYFDGDTPAQQGSVFELREHQEEALASLIKMREAGKTIALVQGATGSGKEQVQQLLLNNPKDIMKGTAIYGGVVYAYVTVIKSTSTKDELKYVDGYIDANTFQWETVANVSEKELNALKTSTRIHIFVRKIDNEDGIQLPFTYIGSGKMEYIEGSKKPNGAHLFRIPMEETAPEDIFFDFKLPANG